MSSPATLINDTRALIVRYRSTAAIPVGYAPLQPLADAAPGFVEQVNLAAARFVPETIPSELLSSTGPMMFRATKTAMSAALNHKKAFREADAKLRAAPEKVNAAFHAERRLRFRGLKQAEEMNAVAAADLADLAALTVDGNLAHISPAGFELANERFLIASVMGREGIAATYRLKPSAAAPLADEVDATAARRAAEAIIAGHEADGDAVSIHERALREWVALLATSYGLSPDAAFERVVNA